MNESQYQQLMRICDRPGMYVLSKDWQTLCAYIAGVASTNGCLTGEEQQA